MAAVSTRVWTRRLAYGVVAAFALTGIVFGVRGPQGFSTLFEKQREIQRLQEENANLIKDIQERRERIRRLKDDPSFQDEVIRRNLKRSKPGETTLIYPSTPAAENTR